MYWSEWEARLGGHHHQPCRRAAELELRASLAVQCLEALPKVSRLSGIGLGISCKSARSTMLDTSLPHDPGDHIALAFLLGTRNPQACPDLSSHRQVSSCRAPCFLSSCWAEAASPGSSLLHS